MPVQQRLDEAVEAVLDAVETALQAAVTPGGLLEGAAEVVRGDRARPRPDVPAVWIFAEMATISHTTSGLAELWTLPVVLAALIVETEDPPDGYREATRWAGRALEVVLREGTNRNLGLDFVEDVVSSRFEASSPRMRQKNIYWSDAVVDVRFRRLET